MTIAQLHKITGALIAKGHARKGVCISKGTFKHNLEPDGCTILPVEKAELQTYEMMDDDGFADVKANGAIRTGKSLVLEGAA